jgi:hypothetical protein
MESLLQSPSDVTYVYVHLSAGVSGGDIRSPLSRGSQVETYVHLPAGGSQADAEPDIRICHDTSYV